MSYRTDIEDQAIFNQIKEIVREGEIPITEIPAGKNMGKFQLWGLWSIIFNTKEKAERYWIDNSDINLVLKQYK
jgi:hypothetical protein